MLDDDVDVDVDMATDGDGDDVLDLNFASLSAEAVSAERKMSRAESSLRWGQTRPKDELMPDTDRQTLTARAIELDSVVRLVDPSGSCDHACD